MKPNVGAVGGLMGLIWCYVLWAMGHMYPLDGSVGYLATPLRLLAALCLMLISYLTGVAIRRSWTYNFGMYPFYVLLWIFISAGSLAIAQAGLKLLLGLEF
jgi:hypothetical protein